ncbi:hypothetical protein F5877DRAFT_72366 [Lentinula edodes]|nr:hypothetical protein F5877DRAFT_72366 [Lentinula edodes]
MNMTPSDYSRLQQTLHGNFFYLGRECPFPNGCGWFVLDGKKTYCTPLTAGQEAPTYIPFQIVGRVGTNLNNTGIFGGWTPMGQYPPNNSRCTFQLGPPLAGVFRNDWIAAIMKLKEIQTAGANNTRKVRYLFVHENVPPLDSLDLDDGEALDDVLYSSIPKNKREDADWTDIRLTKGLAPFPLFGMNDEPIPLQRARSVIGGQRPQIGLLLTPPTTPQNSLNQSNVIVGESGASPYQGMIQQHLNGDPKPHQVLGAAFENTNANFSTGNIRNQTGGAVERYHANPPPVDPHFSGASPGMNRSGHGYRPEYYTYEGGADGNTGNSMYGMHGRALHDKVYDHDKNFTLQDPAGVPVKNTIVTTHDTPKLVHNFGSTVSGETDGGQRDPGTDENTLDSTTVDNQRSRQTSELKLPRSRSSQTAPTSSTVISGDDNKVTSALKHGRGADDDNDADKGHRLLKKGKSRAL